MVEDHFAAFVANQLDVPKKTKEHSLTSAAMALLIKPLPSIVQGCRINDSGPVEETAFL